MCTADEAASHGHEARSGNGRKGKSKRASTPDPAAMANVSSCLSSLAMTSVFHPACRSAAPRTARVTGSVSSIAVSADHLLEQRRHALDRHAALIDRLFGAVVVHGGEVRKKRGDQHVCRVAGKAAARNPDLDDVERDVEHL